MSDEMTRRGLMALLAVGAMAAAAAAGGGCRDAAQADTAPAVSAAPAALQLSGDRPAVSYRFVDPDSGQIGTASGLEDVPAAARAAVIVFDADAPSPPGWEQVADLSAGYPVATTPTAGYALRARTRVAAAPAGAPTARRSGAHQVVMFSTRGCGYCKKARSFFEAKRVPFTEYDVERDPGAGEKLAAMGKKAGAPPGSLRGVPILFVDGQVIPGWDKPRVKRLLGI